MVSENIYSFYTKKKGKPKSISPIIMGDTLQITLKYSPLLIILVKAKEFQDQNKILKLYNYELEMLS